MKKTPFFVVLTLLMVHGLHAQTQYLGFRADIGIVMPSYSETVTVKTSTAFGGGMTYFYPYSPKLDLAIDLCVSFYNMTSNMRTLTGASWTTPKEQVFSMMTGDMHYVMFYSFGEQQTFKLGAGGFYGIVSKSSAGVGTEYLGADAAPAKNYNLTNLIGIGSNKNYGVVAEGIYNMNDKLQFSMRYKLGFANLYKQPSGSTATWNQSMLNISAMYFFNAGGRGGGSKKKVDL